MSSDQLQLAIDTKRVRAMVEAIRARTTIEVCDDEQRLAHAGLATIPDPSKPGAVVYPSTVGDVSALMRIANEYQVPIWPVSKGRNWGYGSGTPALQNTVVLHLERMNRIHEVDEALAYAVIEPGVTYRQLKQHLETTGSRLWMDCTDGPPDGSVIANALERGMGVTHYADHFATLCGFEVVLADGSVMRTGGGDSNRCPTWNTHKWGVGPYVEGLFSQSNFGIVVRAGVWLFPAPESYCAFTFDLARDDELSQLVDVVRELMLKGVLTAGVHIVNAICALSVVTQYPPELVGRVSRLPDDVVASQRLRFAVPGWSLGGGIIGTRRSVQAVRRELRNALGRFGKLTFVTERIVRLATCIERAVGHLAPGSALRVNAERLFRRATGKPLELVPVVRHLHEVMQGRPSDFFVRHAYFKSRIRKPDDAHPDRDNVGKIWLAPVVPMRGAYVSETLKELGELFDAHQFDFYAALLAQNARTLIVLLCIFFSKDDVEEVNRARALEHAIHKKMQARGLQSYRTGVQSPPPFPPEYAEFLGHLKSSLDPNDVLAPGKSGVGLTSRA